jgi:hypothetical protein
VISLPARPCRARYADAFADWSAPFAISRPYALEHCDLGYALTWHTVEGRTVSVGIGLVNHDRTRRGLYVAMSRGARRNEIYAYPSAQEPAASAIGRPPAADAEVTRLRKLDTEAHARYTEAVLEHAGPADVAEILSDRRPVAHGQRRRVRRPCRPGRLQAANCRPGQGSGSDVVS